MQLKPTQMVIYLSESSSSVATPLRKWLFFKLFMYAQVRALEYSCPWKPGRSSDLLVLQLQDLWATQKGWLGLELWSSERAGSHLSEPLVTLKNSLLIYLKELTFLYFYSLLSFLTLGASFMCSSFVGSESQRTQQLLSTFGADLSPDPRRYN